MSKNRKPYQTITEQELLDYLEGKITGERANAIERHLLNSSFEEEAFEGLSDHDPQMIKKDLQMLREKVRSQSTSQKSGFFNIAATISFLIISMATIWFVVDKALPNDQLSIRKDSITSKSIPDIAIVEKPAKEPEKTQTKEAVAPPAATEASEPTDSIISSEPLLAETEIEEEIKEEPIEEDLEMDALAEIDNSVEAEFSEESVDEIQNQSPPVATVENAITKKQETAVRSAAGAVARSSLAPEKENLIAGTVYYKEDGEPLPGVSITANGQGTVAKADGSFTMQMPDSGDQIVFSYVGMKNKSVTFSGQENLDVVLEPDVSSLEEVVVVGYGTQYRSASTNESSETNKSPEPASGLSSFKDYLKTELEYPTSAKTNNVEGVVVLKLTISSEGTINNIEVKKSLGYGCDQEAIRLIKEGPDWNAALYNGEPIEGSVRVRIKFDL